MSNNSIRLVSSDARLGPNESAVIARKIVDGLPVKPETYGDKFMKNLGASVVKLVQDFQGAETEVQRSALQSVTLGTAWERSAADRNTSVHQNTMQRSATKADERIRQAVVAMALRTSDDFERLMSSLTSDERTKYEDIKSNFIKETLNSCTAKERGEARAKYVKAFGDFRAEVIVRVAKSAEATDAVTAKSA